MTRSHSDADFDPRIADWLEGLVDRAPSTTLPAVTAAVPLITQRRPRRLPWRNSPMTRFALLGATAALVAAVGVAGLALTSRSPAPSVGGPGPTQSPSATQPAITLPPNLPTPGPVFPTTTLPDPVGEPLPADLVGRTYAGKPPHVQGSQELILTLRAADDPHCAALFPDGSTCFTILWTPNWPRHITDPAARGAARIVDGDLALRFDWVPDDKACEGQLSTYGINDGGATLSGIDTACGFPAFTAD